MDAALRPFGAVFNMCMQRHFIEGHFESIVMESAFFIFHTGWPKNVRILICIIFASDKNVFCSFVVVLTAAICWLNKVVY